MHKVRAKMVMTELNVRYLGGNYTNKVVRLDARYDEDTPENLRFQQATPTGHCEMMIDNPTALEFFEPGKEYYVDFVRVEDEAGASTD